MKTFNCFFKQILLFILLISFYSCKKESFKDFNIVIDDGSNIFNTSDSSYIRNYKNGEKKIKISFTEKEKGEIYNFIVENGIDTLNEIITNCPPIFPAIYYEIKIKYPSRDNIQILKWEYTDCDSTEYIKMEKLYGKIKDILFRKKEIRNLKNSDIIRI